MKKWLGPLMGAFLFATAAATPAKAFIIPIPIIAVIGAVLGIGVGTEVYEHEKQMDVAAAVPLCTDACHMDRTITVGPRPAHAPPLRTVRKAHKAAPAAPPVVVETPVLPPAPVIAPGPDSEPPPVVAIPKHVDVPMVPEPQPKKDKPSFFYAITKDLGELLLIGFALGIIITAGRSVYNIYKASKGTSK